MEPRYKGSRVLASDELAVELMDPVAPDRYNRGVRFTPVAAVIQARLGDHTFLFEKSDPDPLVDVAGLFAEFDLVTPPPGFESAALDQAFVKVGVGALAKTEEHYRFFGQYPVVARPETEAAWRANAATFRQALPPVAGYGYDLGATVSVAGCRLVVRWALENTGDKPFTTHHYAHNSFLFDHRPVGPGYVVAFPFDFDAQGLPDEQRQVGREVHFDTAVREPANIRIEYPAGYAGENTVSVLHAPSGLRVDCETSWPGDRVALHAADIYVCPEQFIRMDLSPGNRAEWTRIYTFEAP